MIYYNIIDQGFSNGTVVRVLLRGTQNLSGGTPPFYPIYILIYLKTGSRGYKESAFSLNGVQSLKKHENPCYRLLVYDLVNIHLSNYNIFTLQCFTF